jgi:hypothetical protein
MKTVYENTTPQRIFKKKTSVLKRTNERKKRIVNDESLDSLKENVKKVVIGLDISSSVVGVCAIVCDESYIENKKKPLFLGWINLKNLNNLWEKSRFVEEKLKEIKFKIEDEIIRLHSQEVCFRVGFEEPLQRLSGGNAPSSAGTITMLARFNGMVGLIASQVFEDDAPDGFSVHDARKGAGIILRRGKGVKTPQKEQVFEAACRTLGKDWLVYRTKRDGEKVVRDECMDATDAWVVALAYVNALNKVLFKDILLSQSNEEDFNDKEELEDEHEE